MSFTRCPSCEKYFMLNGPSRECPNCGVHVESQGEPLPGEQKTPEQTRQARSSCIMGAAISAVLLIATMVYVILAAR